MIGNHPTWISCVQKATRAAPEPVHILLTGETGTGKEGLAGLIHGFSNRPGNLTVVNCAGLVPALLESDLFGHEKGSFSGADKARWGLFHAAHTGTLFLDEVGELPLEVQPRILRALNDGKIRRLGTNKEERVDVRIVAATHQPLDQLVLEGRFRRDLYERIAQYRLAVPALRDRASDIVAIALHIIETHQAIRGRLKLTESSQRALMAYPWPGNVRELQNFLVTVVIDGIRELHAEDVALYLRAGPVLPSPAHQAVSSLDPETCVFSLVERGPVRAEDVERALGIQRRAAQRLLQRMALADQVTGQGEGKNLVYVKRCRMEQQMELH